MRANKALRFLSLALFLALPLAGPTDMVWAHAALAAGFMGLAVVAVGKTRPVELAKTFSPLFLMLATAMLVACLQLWPVPMGLLQILSPLSAQWQPNSTSAPISLDPAATQFVIIKLLGAAALVWLVQSSLFQGRHKHKLLELLAMMAAAQAVIGSVAVLGGSQWGPYFGEKIFGRAYATGTFVYHNHMAAYLNLGLLSCLALISHRDSEGDPIQIRRLRVLIFRLLAGVIVIGLTMTHSRGGALSFSVMIAIYLAVSMYSSIRGPQRLVKAWGGPLLLVLSVVLVDVLVVSHWFGLERLAQRVESTSLVTETRDDVAAELLDDLRLSNSGVFGIGLGGFEASFPVLKNHVFPQHYHYAHNDWLELILGLGWGGVILLGLVFVFGLRNHQWVFLAGPYGRVLPVVLIAVVGVHAAVDFACGSYATFMTAIALLAMFTRRSTSKSFQNLLPQPSRHEAKL